MNFLNRTLSSLTAPSFPYTQEQTIPLHPSIWTIYNGTNPKTSLPVTIFKFDLQNSQAQWEPLARNTFKKLKTVRMPGIINAVDFFESDDALCIVTERVIPLSQYLEQDITDEIKLYGLSEIVSTLDFINTKANCLHGNLNYSSVFVNQSGDWKLFGFELLTNLTSDPDQPLYRMHSVFPEFWDTLPDQYNAANTLDVAMIQSNPLKFDAIKLAQFICQLFGGSRITPLPKSKFPAELCEVVLRLRDNARFTVSNASKKLEPLMGRNSLVQLNRRLQDLKIMDEQEKLEFLTQELESFLSSDTIFPPGFSEHKLLPELLVQFNILSKASTDESTKMLSIVLNYILKFSKDFSEDAFKKSVKPIIMAHFGSSNRAVRMIFLNYLPDYEPHLTSYEVESKIFSEVITGLYDSNSIVRETSLTSVSTIIDKVSQKQINNDLLRILAKSQMDPQPTIRVNTLILIIKISSKIYKASRNNVLITALSKSLRDTFTPCKMTALSGFKSLIDQFSLEEICTKVLGQLAGSLMDPKSAKVRREAKSVFEYYLAAVEKHASTLPEEDEEDEEREVAEFYEKEAKQKEEQEKTSVAPFSLGWNVVNKLLSSESEGPINRNFNPSTPDLTQSPQPILTETPVAEVKNGLNEDDLKDGWNDFGWNSDEEEQTKQPKNSPSSSVKSLSLGKKGLRLGKTKNAPGSTLKLTIEEDDGWGDEW